MGSLSDDSIFVWRSNAGNVMGTGEPTRTIHRVPAVHRFPRIDFLPSDGGAT